jgi:histidyl-tRNA synthetase
MTEEQFIPQAPAGTHDVMPPESFRWQVLVARFAEIATTYGFGLVHTPMFEDVRVFHRGLGDIAEVVSKEMYEFEDRGGRRLALRPEGTAPVVRAFIQHRPATPFKAWYVSPSFRYERPQAGRFRQHHQLGVEVLGSDDADIDVEVIAMASRFFRGLGLQDVRLIINSMGCEACRPAYVTALSHYLSTHQSALCDEHAERWEQNPLRVLDCKKDACVLVTSGGPILREQLCQECSVHHDRVRGGLTELGLSAIQDDRLVRGFDYYTRTTFEFSSSALESAQNAIGGGGRYDGLVETLGGPPTPGIGFGVGMERVLLACDAEQSFVVAGPNPAVFMVDVTGDGHARRIVAALRERGIFAERAYDGRSMKAQLKVADRSGADFAGIIGEHEAQTGSVTIRALRHKAEQETLSVEEFLSRFSAVGDRS